MRDGVNALENALFAELAALQAVDASDKEAARAAIERAKAVESLAGRITDNHRVALDASRLMAQSKQQVRLPKLLDEGLGEE